MGSLTCSPMSGEWPKTLLGSALLLDLCTLWAPGRLPPPAEWKVGSSGSGAQVPGTLATTVLPHRVPHLIPAPHPGPLSLTCKVGIKMTPLLMGSGWDSVAHGNHSGKVDYYCQYPREAGGPSLGPVLPGRGVHFRGKCMELTRGPPVSTRSFSLGLFCFSREVSSLLLG